jgi:uncharacterized protein YqeY
MLLSQIKESLTSALKEKRDFEVGVFRQLLAAIYNRAIEKRGQGKGEDLSDAEVIEVLRKEAKKRREAIEFFNRGGRPDLVEKESRELSIIERYLPAQLTEDDIRSYVEKVFASGVVKAEDGFGAIMKEVMKALKGKADAASVSKIVQEKIKG